MSRPAKRAKKTLLAAKRGLIAAAQFLGGLRRSFAATPVHEATAARTQTQVSVLCARIAAIGVSLGGLIPELAGAHLSWYL